MHPMIRAAALALALQQAAVVTAVLAAQGQKKNWATQPACPLVTEKEVEVATGLDYGPGDEIEQEYEWIKGGETCMWGGPSMVGEDLPEINITLIAAIAGQSHVDARSKRKLQPGCTREPVGGVADRAFAESCQGTLQSASVFVRKGKSEIVVSVYQREGKTQLTSSPKPVAIAITKAVAARAPSQ